MQRSIALLLSLSFLVLSQAHISAQEEKRRTGALTGTVTDKGDSKDGRNSFVEVKGDGEEKGRKYWPVGDKKRGGPDREILAAIRKVDKGARVRLEWVDAGDGKDISKFEVLKPGK
jgi:hypothetical protein